MDGDVEADTDTDTRLATAILMVEEAVTTVVRHSF